METIIEIGKIDYNGTGKKGNLVTLEVNLKETPKGYVFCMSGNVWNNRKTNIYAGGQICDEIARMFPTNKLVQRLVKIWKQYHLNDMHSGTIKQEQAIKEAIKSGLLKGYDYTLCCDYLKTVGLYQDNNYTYGTAWLFQAIPDYVIEEIKTIIKNN